MSDKESKRYDLLKRVFEGKLTLVEVTGGLGVCYRQAKRLKKAAGQGIRGMAHVIGGDLQRTRRRREYV